MEKEKFFITPDTRIGKILENYPESDKILMKMSPAFSKLSNPVLRKTVAKVATIRQIAKVGSLSVNTIINTLHKELGINHSVQINETEDKQKSMNWVDKNKIVKTLDARPLLENGGHPISHVQEEIKKLQKDEIYLLITPFNPAPLLEAVEKQGFKTASVKIEEDEIHNYISLK